MKNLMKSLLLCSIVILIGTEAEAARRDNRQVRQRSRISDGVQSGELTRGEAHKLRQQQRHIRRVEKRAEADGTVTAGEKFRIEKAQDRASKNIYRKKHNKADRNSSEAAPASDSTTDTAAPESTSTSNNQ